MGQTPAFITNPAAPKVRTVRYIRPKLYPKQARAFFNPARIGTCEASTKSGKTHGGMTWLFEEAALKGRPGRNFWWVAPVYAQAKIAYRRMKRAIETKYRVCNDGEMTITLGNGAVIWFKSGEKPDNLYGEDVFAAVIDEASRMRAESWYAVRSTLTATRGPVRIIGNVKGRKNWFYYLCRKGEANEPGYSYEKITALDAVAAGVLDKEEIEGAKRDLPEDVFRELYMAEPSEDGSNPFGLKHIKACAVLDGVSMTLSRAFGIDLAKSVDWTVILGLDSDYSVSTLERFQKPWEETITTIHATVSRRGPALVDSTGVGDPILESLQRGGNSTRYEGYKFSSASKQMLMEGLAVAIQSHTLKIPKDGVLRMELENFEYEYTRTGVRYSCPAGMHDDTVMALALAWRKASIALGIAPQKGGGTIKSASRSRARHGVGSPSRYGRSQY